MVLESEQGIYLIDEACYVLDLVADLLRSHEDMGIILCEAAYTHKTVKLTGFLMTVNDTKLAHTERKVTVGTRLGSINKNAARAVHRFDRVIFAVDHSCIHVVLIVIPVTGCLPEASV